MFIIITEVIYFTAIFTNMCILLDKVIVSIDGLWVIDGDIEGGDREAV